MFIPTSTLIALGFLAVIWFVHWNSGSERERRAKDAIRYMEIKKGCDERDRQLRMSQLGD